MLHGVSNDDDDDDDDDDDNNNNNNNDNLSLEDGNRTNSRNVSCTSKTDTIISHFESSGCHGGVFEDSALLGNDTASLCNR